MVEEARTIVESVKKLEVINAATGKLRCIQITRRCGKTFSKLQWIPEALFPL